MSLDKRYIATIRVEADSALAVSTGKDNIHADNTFVRDAFGIPYLPGTGLTGALRHSLKNYLADDIINDIFGFGENKATGGKPSQGSRIIVSSAHLFFKETVLDGQKNIAKHHNEVETQVLKYASYRDHVRINHRGVSDEDNHGKFENEYLPKGLQFVFEIELWGKEEDKEKWERVLQTLQLSSFRIGGNTRKGFGKLKVLGINDKSYNLTDSKDLNEYLEKSAQLSWKGSNKLPKIDLDNNYETYTIKLKPKDFFLFDGQFDMEFYDKNKDKKAPGFSPKREYVLVYDNDKGYKVDYQYLIPASSVKGALAHRVAYHYNRKIGNYVEQSIELLLEVMEDFDKKWEENGDYRTQEYYEKWEKMSVSELEKLRGETEAIPLLREFRNFENNQELTDSANDKQPVAENNTAVRTLFGESSNFSKGTKGHRGQVVIEDIYLGSDVNEKVLNHVKIDRFTGGAMDKALFTETVLTTEKTFTLSILVHKDALKDAEIKEAWKASLEDLCKGCLPLGGGVMRGHGMMSGVVE